MAVLDVDKPTAMLMTIRINRAKGTHVAVEMSAIMRELTQEWGMDRGLIATEIGGTKEEVDLTGVDGRGESVTGSHNKTCHPTYVSDVTFLELPCAAWIRLHHQGARLCT